MDFNSGSDFFCLHVVSDCCSDIGKDHFQGSQNDDARRIATRISGELTFGRFKYPNVDSRVAQK